VPFDLGFQWQMAESPRLRKKMAKTHIFSLPHLVSRVSHAFGVSGFLVRVVSVLLRFVCVGAFFLAFVHHFAVCGLVFVFVSESACGSVFWIVRVFSGVVQGKLPPLFYSFLCCASPVSLDDVPE
jgi:hypothetical protein